MVIHQIQVKAFNSHFAMSRRTVELIRRPPSMLTHVYDDDDGTQSRMLLSLKISLYFSLGTCSIMLAPRPFGRAESSDHLEVAISRLSAHHVDTEHMTAALQRREEKIRGQIAAAARTAAELRYAEEEGTPLDP